MKIKKYWKIWLTNDECKIPSHYSHLTKEQIYKQRFINGRNHFVTFVMHHLDGDHSNNDPKNLYLMTYYQHNLWHNLGKHHSESTKQKISAAMSGDKHPNYGIKSENHPMYGKHHSESAKQKISTANSGEKNSQALFTNEQYQQIYEYVKRMREEGYSIKIASNILKIRYPQTKSWSTFRNIYHRLKAED